MTFLYFYSLHMAVQLTADWNDERIIYTLSDLSDEENQ